jgi:protein SCO1/2
MSDALSPAPALPAAESPAKPWPRFNVALLSALIVLPFLLLLTVMYRAQKRDVELPRLGALPEFQGTERAGVPFASADLKGKVWVAGFFFTRCKGPCPLLSQRMAKLQLEFKQHAAFRLVSFTLDPEQDTPTQLRTYAEGYGADPEMWKFLQLASWEEVQNLSQASFHLTALEDPEAVRTHDPRLVLVDANGQMRGAYMVLDEEGWLKLRKDLAQLLRGIKL